MCQDNYHLRLFSITLFSFLVYCVSVESQTLNRPPAARVERFVHISVDPAVPCSGPQGGVECNTTCPTRESTPNYQTPLKSKSSLCNDAEVEGIVGDAVNGHVMFNGSSAADGCPSVSFSPAPSSAFFTLSAWVKVESASISAYDALSIDSNNMEYVLGQIRFLRKAYTIGNDWTFIAIRYNGYFSWFYGTEVYTQSTLTPPAKNVTFGGKGLGSTDELSFADARWFNASLTDREIAELRNGTFQQVSPQSECRCPETHPTLIDSNWQGQSHFCTDGSGTVHRLNKGAGYIAYINDGDFTTAWKSGLYGTATVSVNLSSLFQIKELALRGIESVGRLIVDLKVAGDTSGRFIFQDQQCGGNERFCFATYLSGGSFRFPFEYNNPTNRAQLEKLKADNIQLMFDAINGNQVFTVTEIEVEARCHCLNNDASCDITNGSYKCSCETNSHTSGTHCNTCVSGFYRDTTDTIDTVCQHDCNCNENGRANNQCEELGGRCHCKSNVMGDKCDTCKHNTADLGSSATDGCTTCTCNSDGIVRCNDDFSCTCKSNVEPASGKCRACLPDHYDITNPGGCLECGCDDIGSQGPHCDLTNGGCFCKSNVEGRQCKTCKTGFYDLDKRWPGGCGECQCNFVGTRTGSECDLVTGQCPCTLSLVNQTKLTEEDRICKPQISSIFPTFGPAAGGTLITITGRFFGITSGSDITFNIDSNVQDIQDRNESRLVFKSSPVTDLGEKNIALIWGNREGKTYQELLDAYRFTYKSDPVVKPPTKSVVSYASGGCRVILEGTNLKSVATPTLNVHTQTTTVETPICTHTSDASITCPTPNISMVAGTPNMSFHYGVGLDGVTNFTNITNSDTLLTIVPDAIVDVVDSYDDFKNTFDKDITVKGKNLLQACLSPGDVLVKIGDKTCEIKERTDDYIKCDPNEDFPGTSREERVIVHIGSREIYTGKINFVKFWSVSYFIIAVSVFAAVVMVIVVVCIVCYVRRMRRMDPSDIGQYADLVDKERESYSNPYSDNPIALIPTATTEPPEAADTKPHAQIVAEFIKLLKMNVRVTTKSSIIEKSQIEPGNRCTHKGNKIRIINGKFSTSSPNAGDCLTVKTLLRPYNELINGGCLPDWLSDGLLECTRLRDFTNEYILRLLGIAVDDKQIFIIYPAMSNKTLKDFLLTKGNMSEADRLSLCVDVAEGMNFLDAQHVVHKDLAARNCWVSRDEQVRVSDASFAQDLYPDEYMRENGRNLPVRWMSPESLRQAGFYHSKSDIWSYGVLIWEVFSGGAYLPFFDLKDRQVKPSVCDEHYRLGKPQDCSDAIFSIVEQCHVDKSEDRPNFFLILNHLSSVASPGSTSVSYVNQEALQADIYENMARPKVPPKTFRKK